jgi:putative SOS response-associated peptidase YedK
MLSPMCGRFTLTTPDYGTVLTFLGAEMRGEEIPLYRPRFNVAPEDRHWVVLQEGGNRWMRPALWGFPNRFARPGEKRDSFINARIETAAEKPTFRGAFRERRCVIPADGFYEWSGPKGKKIPYWFHPAKGGLLPFAGLFETDPELRFTILTTSANSTVAPIHDRMPVILPPDSVGEWLERGRLSGSPPPLDPRPVSPRVNSARNDDAACLLVDGARDEANILGH